jgi:hypothetical protein
MANMLPLETFRQVFGIHPWHVHGFADDTYTPVNSKCNTVTKEHAWQDTMAVGRQEIREAIETAETRLREWLGYSVAPHYVTETVPWPSRVFNPTVQLREGYLQAIGTETLVLLENAVPVFTDEDGDGLDETFTLTVATTETDAQYLAVYFAAADRLDSAPVSDRWKIGPVDISISAGTATIIGRRWLLAKPIKFEGLSTANLNPTTAANFVSTVAVYSRHTATPQATLTWESRPWPYFCTCTTDPGADPAAIATASARVAIRDARHGIVAPAEAVYDADTATWSAVEWSACRPPDTVTVNYYAGVPLVNGHMDRTWQTIVARLAAAELARPICACETANRALHTWQTDLARTGGNNDEQFGAISQEDLMNPFGTRRGHVYAWRQVKHLRQLRGFLP